MALVWVGLIVAAVALDLLLLQWLRRRSRRPGGGAPVVNVFGP